MAPAFTTATEAWFWTMRTLVARRHGFLTERRGIEPDAVLKALDRLYRHRRITLEHARVLRAWGEAGATPPASHRDRRFWDEALEALAGPLRVMGVVA